MDVRDIDFGDHDLDRTKERSFTDALEDVVDDILTGRLFEVLADLLEAAVLELEIEEQEQLIEEGHFEAAVLRQATYIESTLDQEIINELETHKGSPISSKEKEFIEHIGNKNKVRLANMLGIFENDKEFQAYCELMSARRNLAHTWWMLFDDDDMARFERTSNKIVNKLGDELNEHNK